MSRSDAFYQMEIRGDQTYQRREQRKEFAAEFRWIADIAGVSRDAMDRILTGGARTPRYDPLRDSSAALECDMAEFDGIYVLSPEANPPEGELSPDRPAETAYDDERYFAMMCVYQDQIVELNAWHDGEIARLHRWLSLVVLICLGLIVILVGILLIDLLNPNIGWIRAHQPVQSARRLAEALRWRL